LPLFLEISKNKFFISDGSGEFENPLDRIGCIYSAGTDILGFADHTAE
jgi:hypothetical protein